MKNTNLVYDGGKIAVHASIFRAAFPALRLLDFTGGIMMPQATEENAAIILRMAYQTGR